MKIINKEVNNNEISLLLEKYGYANIRDFFDRDSIKKIQKEVDLIFNNELNNKKASNSKKKAGGDLREYYCSAYYNANNILSTSLLGKSEYIDRFMKELFENTYFNNICKKIVGDKYRVYTFTVRKILPNSIPLSLHQDNFGILTLSIPLNDISSNSGTTLFLPESHKYPISIINKLLSIPLTFFKFLCIKHTGKIGDLGFFFTKIFHAAQSGESSTIIIIALVGEDGIPYKPWLLPKDTSYGKNFAQSIGKNLFHKLSSNIEIFNINSSSFTKKNSKDKSLDNGSLFPVLLKKGFNGRKIEVLSNLLYSPIDCSYRIIDKVIFMKEFTLKSIMVCSYLMIFLFISILKHNAHYIKEKLLN